MVATSYVRIASPLVVGGITRLQFCDAAHRLTGFLVFIRGCRYPCIGHVQKLIEFFHKVLATSYKQKFIVSNLALIAV